MTTEEIPDESNVVVQTVACSKCDRPFALERIQTHENICTHIKQKRKPYDIVNMRIKGTESEKLVKEGKLKLDPAKPLERKSVLNQKLGQPQKEPLPPIKTGPKPPEPTRKETKNGEAFQIVLDDYSDELKTVKYSKFASLVKKHPKLATEKVNSRYLSAERARSRWISAAQNISPGISALNDDEVDFLAASMSSQKTICSDAFDFLFDSQNLNPDTLKQKLEEDMIETEREQKLRAADQSVCCVIS